MHFTEWALLVIFVVAMACSFLLSGCSSLSGMVTSKLSRTDWSVCRAIVDRYKQAENGGQHRDIMDQYKEFGCHKGR